MNKPDQKTHEDPASAALQEMVLSEQEHAVSMQIVEILKPFTPAQRRQLVVNAMTILNGI